MSPNFKTPLSFSGTACFILFVAVGLNSEWIQVSYKKAILRSSIYTGKCMHPVRQFKGAAFELTNCSRTSSDQYIIVTHTKLTMHGGPIIPSLSQIQFYSNKQCLTGSGNTVGSHIRNWDCLESNVQSMISVVGDIKNQFQIQLENGLCVTAEDRGVYFDLWSCVESAGHQFFTLEYVDAEEDDISIGCLNALRQPEQDKLKLAELCPQKYSGQLIEYRLHNYKWEGDCLNASEPGINETMLSLEVCNLNKPSQIVDFSLQLGDMLTTGNVKIHGLCITVDEKNMFKNGANVVGTKCSDQHLWRIVNGDTGSIFQLQHTISGKCLTARNLIDEPNKIIQWDCYGISISKHQTWKLVGTINAL